MVMVVTAKMVMTTIYMQMKFLVLYVSIESDGGGNHPELVKYSGSIRLNVSIITRHQYVLSCIIDMGDNGKCYRKDFCNIVVI